MADIVRLCDRRRPQPRLVTDTATLLRASLNPAPAPWRGRRACIRSNGEVLPVVGFDPKTGFLALEHPDGQCTLHDAAALELVNGAKP